MSRVLKRVSHEPFEATAKAREGGMDIVSTMVVLENLRDRRRVSDTDIGLELKLQVEDLLQLVAAYRKGYIIEKK